MNSTELALQFATGISWDGCHKIYILLDEESWLDQLDCGYGRDEGTECIRVEDATDAYETIKTWWDDSCGLKFVNGVRNGGHMSEDFIQIISQGEDAPW